MIKHVNIIYKYVLLFILLFIEASRWKIKKEKGRKNNDFNPQMKQRLEHIPLKECK